MHKSVLPNILISLGYIMVLLGTRRPLLEWQISNITTDMPPTYEVHLSSYPVTTSLGRSLDDSSYFGRIYVSKEAEICDLQHLNFDARRLQKGGALEQISLKHFSDENITWLIEWILRSFILSVIYIWLFTIWYKHSIWEAAVFSILAGIIFILLTQIVRPFLWTIGPSFDYFGDLECNPGTVTFNVTLLKVHYETLLVLFVGVIAELGALGMMLQQIIKAVIEKKSSFKLIDIIYSAHQGGSADQPSLTCVL